MTPPDHHKALHRGLRHATMYFDDPQLAELGEWATRMPESAEPPTVPTGEEVEEANRYEDQGFIARGGMGEIRRVYDRRLDRPVVQKILRATEPRKIQRFWVEATVTARLEHPGIIPVHDFSTTEDGAPFFTMKEVKGDTFADLIERLHAASKLTWGRTDDGLTLRKAVDVLHRAAQTVAYAHNRGIVHRDLKPLNIMVGAFGEVLVLDWGIALVDPRAWRQELPELDREGQVSGTPVYMPPEQARGELSRVGPWTDVWALGAMLYHLLTGQPPYRGRTVDILRKLRAGQAPDVEFATGLPIPHALRRLCARSLTADPLARPAEARTFADALGDWLDGDRREEEARQLVAKARRILPELARLRGEADQHRHQAEALLADVKSWDPVERKRPAWREEDAAAELEREAELREIEMVHTLRAALTRAPELGEAHKMLAQHFRQLHEAALEGGDQRTALRAEAQLRRHDRGAHAQWLEGVGHLSLDTEPSGLPVRLLRFVEEDRRLVPVDTGTEGVTPLHRLAVPEGSYLCRVDQGEGAAVDIPVLVQRGRHSDGVRPGDAETTPVPLPRHGDLGPDDCYVPAGWFLFGNPEARGGLPRRRVWVDGFVMRRYPVTNREYLAFLNDLVDQGRGDAAEAHVPRDTVGDPGGEGPPVYHREGRGHWFLGPDATGDTWLEDWPVFLVTWHDARAFAAWEAERAGQPWRLPWEVEWEKAAASVDGRAYPWGEHGDPSWFRCAGGVADRSLPAVVGDHPEDVSPTGIRGLAGNLRDWVLDSRQDEGADIGLDGLWTPGGVGHAGRRVSRGGAWSGSPRFGLCGTRFSMPASNRLSVVGFRLCRSWAQGQPVTDSPGSKTAS